MKRRLKQSNSENKKAMKSLNAINNRSVETAEKLSIKRYFDDDKSSEKPTTNATSQMIENSEIEKPHDSITSSENVEQIIVVRKPKVGALPSFIPIG